MAAATLRILRRTLRLPQLQQGGTLSISVPHLVVPPPATNGGASSAHRLPRLPPLTVRIVPGWRDDAELELWQQIFVQDGGGDDKKETDDLVVGMSAAQNEEGGENRSSTSTDSARSLLDLGKSSGDICLRLGLLSESAAWDTKSSNEISHDADDVDVQDMVVPVEIEDDDDDDEEEEPSRFILDDDEPSGVSTNADASKNDDDEQDDIFAPTGVDAYGLNSLTLVAAVPEKINLRCHLGGPGNIIVEGKVEGQDGFDLQAASGNIKVKKLRGDSVRLFAGRGGDAAAGCSSDGAGDGRVTGIVYATDLVEAQSVSIEAATRVRAKMVNGTDVSLSIVAADSPAPSADDVSPPPAYNKPLEVDDTGALIDIGSLYTTKNGDGAKVEVLEGSFGGAIGTPAIPRAVRIKSSHGHVSVATSAVGASDDGTIRSTVDEFGQAIVELGGVNGSCDVIINTAETKDHPSLPPSESDKGDGRCIAARVHVDSLTPDSVSFVSAGHGDVDLTVDRKVEADLRLVSTSNVAKVDVDALLVDDEDGVRKECARLDSLSLDGQEDPTSVITKDVQPSIYVQTNSFSPTHRETLPRGTEYVEGSIHNRSFEPDSRFDVKTKPSSATAGAAAHVNKGIGKVNITGAAAQALSGFSGKKGGEHNPLVAVASSGSIKVETVSWFGAIARRYGMDDRGRKDVGRTASREGRLK